MTFNVVAGREGAYFAYFVLYNESFHDLLYVGRYLNIK